MASKLPRTIVAGIATFCLLVTNTSAKADVTPAQVETSIARGINYLRSQQRPSGGWDEYGVHKGGLSALCTLALSTSGVANNDPAIAKALNYLRKLEPVDTYSVSLQTLAFCQVGAAEDLPRIQRNVRWLEKTQLVGGGASLEQAGSWTYRENIGGLGDPSNSQFALLALAAAEDRGVGVSKAVFEKSLAYWQYLHEEGGGWPYTKDLAATGSMTSAGIASTIICRGRLAGGSSQIINGKIECCGQANGDDNIEQGLAWLGKNFSVVRNPGPPSAAQNLFYYLYALERVGRLTGRRLIGGHDWYREGAIFLTSIQDPLAGYWAGSSIGDNSRTISTSFALLFLAKGKRQVVLGQLDYSPDNAPVQPKHPEASRQLVRHLERDWGRDLTWQTVKLNGSSVSDLLQTPVLLIAGTEPLRFDAEQKKRLKEYVEQGGFIFFEATAGDGCGSPEPFERSVQALCKELFENPLERLPPTHPIWFAERKADPTPLGEKFWVYGVQACCRTAVAYVPASLTCRWELSDPTGRTRYPDSITAELNAAVSIGQNIVAYATGRELRDKLDMPSILEGETEERAGERGVLTLPRLALGAGGEEAGRAIPNLARYVDRDAPIRITTDSPLIPISSDSLESYAVAWMHGRRNFELNDQQAEALREFLENGGTLLIDSICGNEEFSASVRAQLARVLPDSPLKPLAPNHPLLTSAYGGYDLSNVTLQTPNRGGSGAVTIERKTTAPIIEAAKNDGRIVVLFSPYDLSCALESQSSLQCPGYITEDAAKIGINMLMFLLLQETPREP